MTAEPNRVEAIFAAALEKASLQERTAYLDEACADDAELRQRVEALLRTHDDAGNFLEKPAVAEGVTTDDSEPVDRAVSGIVEGPGTAHWSVQTAPTDRRGRHGCRLHGGAARAHPPDGRAEEAVSFDLAKDNPGRKYLVHRGKQPQRGRVMPKYSKRRELRRFTLLGHCLKSMGRTFPPCAVFG